MIPEIQKVVTLRGIHTKKSEELQKAFGWSGRRLACFVMAYTHEIDTIEKSYKTLFPETQPQRANSAKSIFIPMTPEEASKIDQLIENSGFDFTTNYKNSLDVVYTDWKAGKLNFKKNRLTERFINKC
ncbi:hypothetical protein [Burkholderia cenocepacia]|uniref:hypothetical protein n=1 Tax=Burkholderia cenocepacia TaxID=95486 RepID=UPI001178901E|nr:hypothetical protein [Burkholderia cenocepacia]MCW5156294.1 hypothetical protein [Burkholderia cenocepacia]